MRIRSIAAAIAGLTALGLTVSACGSDDPTGSGAASVGQAAATQTGAAAGLKGELNGAGATSMESAQDAWRAAFQASNPDVTMAYDPVGSGGGRTQFLSGAVSFAGSDSAMTTEEIEKSKTVCTGSQAYDLPIYVSPIAVVYRLDGVKDLQLAPATIAKIFDGKITAWNDAAIKADNPGVDLPDTAITPVHRSDDSGTTKNFTDYLATAAKDAWPYEADGVWPIQGGQSAQGTSGLVETVTAGQGTIGYADESKAGSLGIAKLKVGDAYVAPSAEGAAAVIDASPRDTSRAAHDIVVKIDRATTAKGAYPLVLISYGVVCGSYADASQAELVKAYLGYVASQQGQEIAATAAGSAPISDTLRADVLAAVDSITAG